ncbi:hypothetical protein G6F22_019823 [Rhizopus arrhizus]|nr:hypothetical protein G6F22_019823 [Rhizopus arrhizus]KAG0931372.1 hypothetical protein G6F31_016800 [Rhizopus arrhizus]
MRRRPAILQTDPLADLDVVTHFPGGVFAVQADAVFTAAHVQRNGFACLFHDAAQCRLQARAQVERVAVEHAHVQQRRS